MSRTTYRKVAVKEIATLAEARGNTEDEGDVFTTSSGTTTVASGYTDITDDVLAFTVTRPRSIADRTGVASRNTINTDGRGNPECRLTTYNDNAATPNMFASGKGYYAVAVLKENSQAMVFVGMLSNTDDQATEPESGRQISAVSYTHLTLPTTPYV